MYRRHTVEEKLEVISLIESGQGIDALCRERRLDHHMVRLWLARYRTYGEEALRPRPSARRTPFEKETVVQEFLIKGVPLARLCLKYGIARSSIKGWVRQVRESGYESLSIARRRGRPPKGMGRPKKREPQTEMEKLQAENLKLRAEVALLKKVKALVEEKQARTRLNGRRPSTR